VGTSACSVGGPDRFERRAELLSGFLFKNQKYVRTLDQGARVRLVRTIRSVALRDRLSTEAAAGLVMVFIV
jgi:hypothetical protein